MPKKRIVVPVDISFRATKMKNEKTIKPKKAKPKLTAQRNLDIMKSKLWTIGLVEATGAKSFYGLKNWFSAETYKNFYKYRIGTAITSEGTIKYVDARLKKEFKDFDTLKNFCNVGPLNDVNQHVPLWDAISGSMEKTWEVLVRFDPPIELDRMRGAPFISRVFAITNNYFPLGIPDNFVEVNKPNQVGLAYLEGKFDFNLELMTATIAAWRLANFIGDSQRIFNYIMIGLLEKAIPDLLEPYGIFNQLKAILKEQDSIRLNTFINAAKQHTLIMRARANPTLYRIINPEIKKPLVFYRQFRDLQSGVVGSMRRPSSHDFLIDTYKNTCVSNYLENHQY